MHIDSRRNIVGMSLDLQYQLTVAISDFERLSYLDDIWTQAASRLQNRDDLQTLQAITEEMIRLLEGAGAHAQKVRLWIDTDPQQFEEACRQGFSRLPLDDQPRRTGET